MLTRRGFFGSLVALMAAPKLTTLGRLDLNQQFSVAIDWSNIPPPPSMVGLFPRNDAEYRRAFNAVYGGGNVADWCDTWSPDDLQQRAKSGRPILTSEPT